MSEFQKNSAWDRGHHESDRDFNERLRVNPKPIESIVKTAAVHIATLEAWIDELTDLAVVHDLRDGALINDLEDIAHSIRSHLPG